MIFRQPTVTNPVNRKRSRSAYGNRPDKHYVDHKLLIRSLDVKYARIRFRQHRLIKLLLWDLILFTTGRVKRILDIGFSIILIVLLSPIFFFTALLIYQEEPGPIFHMAIRVGKNGKHFKMYKFRSMMLNADKVREKYRHLSYNAEEINYKIKKDPRITHVGAFIRRTSIDELPQLFNVLKGEMSLVGPRPHVTSEVAQYTLQDRKRLQVTPGITGLWQVSGRSDIPFQTQVELDLEYMHNQSLWNDFTILGRTIFAVLSGRGAY